MGVEQGFLNIEYLLTRTFALFGGQGWGELWREMPSWAHFLLAQIGIWGMVLTLLLVLLVTYTYIKLIIVEHEGFHGKEEHQVHEEETHDVPPQSERWRRVIELASSGAESDWRRA